MREKQQDLSNSLIIWGNDVCNLPQALLYSYAEKISKKLEGPNTISEAPEKLYKAMLDGRSVIAMDVFNNELYGFAQVKQVANSQRWIFNSWTSFAPNIGKPLVWAAAVMVYDIDTQSKLIAKVREGNTKAQKAITETGGVLNGQEASEQHFDPNTLQPIQKALFDITFQTLIPKKPQGESSLDIARKHLEENPIEPRKQKHQLINKLEWFISSVIGLKERLKDFF